VSSVCISADTIISFYDVNNKGTVKFPAVVYFLTVNLYTYFAKAVKRRVPVGSLQRDAGWCKALTESREHGLGADASKRRVRMTALTF
jgi:hypothetical protein